jgi:hypothetical protein
VAKKAPQVGLNDDLRIRVDAGTTAQLATIQIRLDGALLNVVPDAEPRIAPDTREVIFRLEKNDMNRPMWSRLLGRPFASGPVRTVPISAEIAGKPLTWTNLGKADEAPAPEIALRIYDPGWMTLGIAVVLTVWVVTFLSCARTTMMRDSAIPQILLTRRPYSLGRFQMAVWFGLIFASFLFIYAVTFDTNSITPESFVLLGISGATALVSVAIDQSKNQSATQIQQNLDAMGIKTCAEAEKLFQTVVVNKTPNVPASTIIPGANIPANPATGAAGKLAPTAGEMWAEYEAQTKDFTSTGFLKDLVNDVNGPTIHRWQILI